MILTQLIGAVGYTTLGLSYFKKEKKQILFMQIIAYIFFVIHYYLLSGITGAICNLIGLFALITIYLCDKYKFKLKKLISLLFIILLLVINIMTFQNFYSMFPLIASVIVVASFTEDNENIIRIIGVIAAACWLIYALVYKSYVAVVFEIITFIDVIIASFKNIKEK